MLELYFLLYRIPKMMTPPPPDFQSSEFQKLD